MRSLSTALLSFALAAGSAEAQRPATNPVAGLDGYIQDALEKFHGVGLAIAVVKNDSIVYAKGFGVRTLGEPAPVTPRTLFAVGSTTKAFTTAALGMLVDEGRFGWDTRVTDVMKGFELYDPAVTRELTIRDLITHRSGLSRGDLLWMGSNYSRAEVIRRVRYHKPTWSLRTTFGYQNIMFLTAGETIPATTGTSWDDFIKQRIFEPLGMTSSNTTVRGLDKLPDVATPHTTINGKLVPIAYRQIDNIGPAGSINSNVLDMAQWIRFHLNGGTVNGRPLLTPATHAEMFKMQMPIAPGGGMDLLYPGANFLGYGLGWFLYDHAGRKAVEHSGGIDGMTTELVMIPSEKLGVIVLTNNSSSIAAFPVARGVINKFLGVAADPVAAMLPFVAASAAAAARIEDSIGKARAVGKGPSHDLGSYAGLFDNPMFGPAHVAVDSGRLIVSVDAQAAPMDLEHWHYDVFRAASRDRRLGKTWATFRVGADGSIDGFTVEGLEQEFVRRPAAVAAMECEATDPDRTRQATRLSPLDSVAVTAGPAPAKICYSRPSMRGRAIFGGAVVPYDSVWRTGANDPTVLLTSGALEIGGTRIGPGGYSITTVPGRTSWRVIFTDRVTEQEVARVTVASEAVTNPVERFTIRSVELGPNRSELVLEWEKTRVRVPVAAAAVTK